MYFILYSNYKAKGYVQRGIETIPRHQKFNRVVTARPGSEIPESATDMSEIFLIETYNHKRDVKRYIINQSINELRQNLPSLSCSANISSTTHWGGSISRHCSTERNPCLSRRPSREKRSKYCWYSTRKHVHANQHWLRFHRKFLLVFYKIVQDVKVLKLLIV